MRKIFKIKWLYIIGITLLIAFAVTFVPLLSRVADNFEATAMLISVALYTATAVIVAFIVVFIVKMLLKHHPKKEMKSLH